MKRSPAQRIKHNGHFFTFLATIVSAALYGLPGESYWTSIVQIVSSFVVLALFTAHYRNHRSGPCPGCPQWSEKQLTSWPMRTYAGLGRIAVPLSMAVIVALLTISLINPRDRSERAAETGYSLTALFGVSLFLLLFLAVGCAVVFQHTYHQHYHRAPGPVSRWIDELLRMAGHRISHIMTVLVVLTVPLVLLTEDDGVWGSVRSIVLMLILLAMIGEERHAASLCEQCGAALRVDAAEFASRRTVFFKMVHHHAKKMNVLLFGSAITFFFLGRDLADLMLPVFYGMMAAMGWVYRFHSRYSPWCRWCHPRDDGGEFEEVPDPEPGHGRPLPV